MDKLLALASFILGVVIVFTTSSDGSVAILVTIFLAAFAILIIRTQPLEDKPFLTQIFIIALLARLGFGLFIHLFDLREVFGGDAQTYDEFGNILMEYWFDQSPEIITETVLFERMNSIGWGMLYIVGGLYSIIGRNVLAAQFFCAVFGAAISPMLYVCSYKIFNNRRVAQVSAVLVALFPAFIIWTSQLMKDGLIIFLLVLAMIMVINLQKEFKYFDLFLLIFSLFGIISLRFYIFYMIVIAIVATFLVGFGDTSKNLFKRIVILSVIAISLTYLGVARYASSEFEKYGSFEVVQNSRDDAANRSDSGFGEGLDVSTPGGVILVIPIGFTYLMLAPFPWQISNLRQAITLPDMLIWWASIPFLISGLIFSIRNHLRGSMGILIFSIILSVAYSIFQGNVGTAYRQRTQIQVFLFIFIGVGWTLYKERRENKKAVAIAKQREFDKLWRTKRQNNIEILNGTEVVDIANVIDESSNELDTHTTAKPKPIPQKALNQTTEKTKTTPNKIVDPEIEPKQKIFRANKKQIQEVQKVLKGKNLYKGKITGKFNKDFRAAIKQYQSEQKCKKTGTLNKETMQKLGINLTKKQKEIDNS